MAKYSLVFKKRCVKLRTELMEKGKVSIDSIEIRNVRELVKVLDISNDSLYTWMEKYSIEKDDEKDDDNDDDNDDGELDVKELPGEKIKSFDEWELDNTFWMCVARNLGIKNYRMPEKQLYVAIGNELIKRSGLVSNGVRKELRLE